MRGKIACAAFAAAFAAALFAWAFFLWQREIEVFLADVGVYFRDNLRLLEGVPLFVYSLVIFALPIFFLPVTPVFVLAAARAESEPMLSILFYCWLGVTLNILASYFISKKFGAFLRRKLEARGLNVPRLPPYEQYEFVFLMRMIPRQSARGAKLSHWGSRKFRSRSTWRYPCQSSTSRFSGTCISGRGSSRAG